MLDCGAKWMTVDEQHKTVQHSFYVRKKKIRLRVTTPKKIQQQCVQRRESNSYRNEFASFFH